jgi:tetratricopeptide (TPR) repeat protein
VGTVPGTDVTVETAAAIAGLDRPAALRLLRRLTDTHLLDVHRPGRYTYHDLLRRYAVERAHAEDPAPERDGALHRWHAHHLQRARAAAELVYPHMLRLPSPASGLRLSGDAALAWLEAERHNLVLAVRDAAEHGPVPMAWRLADALRGWFHLRRYTGDWMSTGTAALAAAQRAGDPHGEVSARHSLGTAHRSLGAHEEAMAHYTEALRIARACGWAESEATNLGIVCQLTGRLHEAVSHLEAALAVDRRTGRRTGAANNLGNLGDVQLELGRLDEAARSFTAALELHTEGGSTHGQALALTGLGRAFLGLRRYDEATAHLAEARSLHPCRRPGRRGRSRLFPGTARVRRAPSRTCPPARPRRPGRRAGRRRPAHRGDGAHRARDRRPVDRPSGGRAAKGSGRV